MLRALFPEDHPFVLSLFGCQYHDPSPSPAKTDLIDTFSALLARSPAAHVETLEQHAPAPPAGPGPSRIWMTYWQSPTSHHDWWSSSEVSAFRESLPADDAGFWRETLRLCPRRSMFETNKPVPNGIAHAGTLDPLTQKTGYWGAYRDRVTEDAPAERLDSPLQRVPAPRPASAGVRKGRVAMKHFPPNLTLVVEGQDYGAMGPAERRYWKENFDGLSRKWVKHVVDAAGRPDAGLVSARLCHAPESGEVDESAVDAGGGEWPPAFGFNRKVQVLVFLDLACMERIGKTVETHVELRRGFMKAYGPGGEMEKHDLLLWVELGVVGAEDVEAEYVGCYEGTGFLAYDHHPAFQQSHAWWSPWGLVSRASQYVFGTA